MSGVDTAELRYALTVEVGDPDVVIAVHGDPPRDRQSTSPERGVSTWYTVAVEQGDGASGRGGSQVEAWARDVDDGRFGDPHVAATVGRDAERLVDTAAGDRRPGG